MENLTFKEHILYLYFRSIHTAKNIKEYVLGSIRYIWHNLYIRKDEFDVSLSIDTKYYLQLSKKNQKKYLCNLVKRRNKAHYRDIPHE